MSSAEHPSVVRRVRLCSYLSELFYPFGRAYAKAAHEVCHDSITGESFDSDQEVWAVKVGGRLNFIRDEDALLDLMTRPHTTLLRPSNIEIRQFMVSVFPKRRAKVRSTGKRKRYNFKSKRRAASKSKRCPKLPVKKKTRSGSKGAWAQQHAPSGKR